MQLREKQRGDDESRDYEEDADAQVTHIETPKTRHITRKVKVR
jgi:hypothetical protein